MVVKEVAKEIQVEKADEPNHAYVGYSSEDEEVAIHIETANLVEAQHVE